MAQDASSIPPGPTAAEDKLTDKDRERGVAVMDPQWGYRMLVEPSGVLMPPNASVEACESLRNEYIARPTDVFVTTYPKCGTSWMQQVACLLIRGSDTTVSSMSDVTWMEMAASCAVNGEMLQAKGMTVDEMNALPTPTAEEGSLKGWKTHAAVGSVPWKGGVEQTAAVGSKIIIVSRNPKDTAISKYHHTKKLPYLLHFEGEWENFYPLFLEGRISHNSFWDWHRDWWIAKEKYPETILWVHFEDMKKDLGKEIKRISDFMGLNRSEEELAKVTERCTFSSMKSEAKARDDFASKKNHFRSGKSGGWKDFMSEDVVEQFDAKTEKMYSECGLRFDDK